MFLIGAAAGFAAVAVAGIGLMFARAGSLGKGWWALGLAGRAANDAAFDAKLKALTGEPTSAATPPGPSTTAPKKPAGDPLQLLALLQIEARLIDFLFEDIGGASDAQVGLGVREIHKKAAAVLKKHLSIEAVLPKSEGESVTVSKGFDPSAIRLTGQVTGEPPFTGTLQHPGWRVKEVKLPATADGHDHTVLQPAEVELA